jgi:hypothetical protein
MKSLWYRLSVVGLSALIAASSSAVASAADAKPMKDLSFGIIRAPGADQVKAQAADWLKSVNADAATMQKFEAVWADADRPLLDKVADTLALGNADAAKLLAAAHHPDTAAPKELPTVLRDAKANAFFRQNLALAYGKALANRRIYEDALEALKVVKAEQVVDPAAFYFHKAVCEHALLNREDATRSIAKLLDEVSDAPERYKMVAALMFFDMQSWQEKGLPRIGQLMGTVERRLDVARGGPQTQKVEAEIIKRLEEEIKKLENQAKGSGSGNGDGCPSGSPSNGPPGSSNNPAKPMQDSQIGGSSGKGAIDPKDYKDDSKAWGQLPEKERAKAMMRRVADMPASHRKIIEDYYKKVASEGNK